MVFTIAEAMLTFDSMPHRRLQKMCYFAYAWHLVFFGKKLFPQSFEAWEQGPVCPELYKAYQQYGEKMIPKINKSLEAVICENEMREFLWAVYEAHGNLTMEQLEILACSEDPWLYVRQKQQEDPDSSRCMDDQAIIEWYTKKLLKEMKNENISLVYEY